MSATRTRQLPRFTIDPSLDQSTGNTLLVAYSHLSRLMEQQGRQLTTREHTQLQGAFNYFGKHVGEDNRKNESSHDQTQRILGLHGTAPIPIFERKANDLADIVVKNGSRVTPLPTHWVYEAGICKNTPRTPGVSIGFGNAQGQITMQAVLRPETTTWHVSEAGLFMIRQASRRISSEPDGLLITIEEEVQQARNYLQQYEWR